MAKTIKWLHQVKTFVDIHDTILNEKNSAVDQCNQWLKKQQTKENAISIMHIANAPILIANNDNSGVNIYNVLTVNYTIPFTIDTPEQI